MGWAINWFRKKKEYVPADEVIGVLQDDEVVGLVAEDFIVGLVQDDGITGFVDEEINIVVLEDKLEINTII